MTKRKRGNEVGENNGRLRPGERASQPSDDSRVVLRNLFLDEWRITRFSFVGGKSIAKESHAARPLRNRFVTSDQVTSRKCRAQTLKARGMATDDQYSSSFKVKCVRRVRGFVDLLIISSFHSVESRSTNSSNQLL